VIPLQIPLSPPLWGLAWIEATRPQARPLLGEPYFIETDSWRFAGGEEDARAYILPSGRRMLVILAVPYGEAGLIADPPEIEPLLPALGIAPDDPRVHFYPAPFELT